MKKLIEKPLVPLTQLEIESVIGGASSSNNQGIDETSITTNPFKPPTPKRPPPRE